jgi:hypothetical protein
MMGVNYDYSPFEGEFSKKKKLEHKKMSKSLVGKSLKKLKIDSKSCLVVTIKGITV